MNRRWFGKVIGAVVAFVSGAKAATPKLPWQYGDTPIRMGTVREPIARNSAGWVDLDPPEHVKPGVAYVSATKARGLWDMAPGVRVAVIDCDAPSPIGFTVPHIVMSEG